MKSLKVPYIPEIETKGFDDLRLILENKGAKDFISNVNWEKEFGYKPNCNFTIAYSHNYLAILFCVRGLDLRAENIEDNGSVWEDSCCEFFASGPENKNYYNFELNCIGTLLNAVGENRENRTRRDKSELKKVIRFSTLPHEKIDKQDKIYTWETAMLIPFELLGINPESKPDSIKVNFYKCGDKTNHPHFLSWNPIKTIKPDFHRPEFFGEIIFDK